MKGIIRKKQLGPLLGILALTAVIFLTEPLTQLGFAHGFLYVPLALLLHRIQTETWLWPLISLSLILVVLGYFISPPPPEGFHPFYVLANRLLACLLLITTGYLLTQIHQREVLQTEQQQALNAAEKEIQKTRNYYLNLAETLPLSVWTATPEGRISYVSSQMLAICGLTEQELLENWIDYLHPDDKEKTTAAWSESLKFGHPYEIEHRFRLPDGNYIWFLLQAKPIKDRQGKITSWLGSAVDIHHQKQLMVEKNQLVTRLNAVLGSISDGFFTLDKDLHFTYANQQAAKAFGIEADKLLHQAFTEQPLLQRNPYGIDQIKQAMQSGQSLRFEQQLDSGDWYLVSLYPFKDGITVYFRNISSEHQAQEELTLLKSAVSRLNDVIIITEAEPISYPGPKIVYVNDAFERITGYTREEALGRSPRFLQGPLTDQQEIKRLGNSLRQWQPARGQLLNYKKTGEEFWFDLDIIPLADEKGWYTHWVAVERDITEQKQMQQQLIHAQRMESVGQLTGGIAHDFNNLLTVISGNAELLKEQLTEQPQLQALATTAAKAADRGAQLTRSLLTFARKQTLEPETVDINQLIKDMQPLIKSSLGERYPVELQLEEKLWSAMIDPGQLENTLLNMVINARDATPLGGHIRLSTQNTYLDAHYAHLNPEVSSGSYVLLQVEDEGSGIHPDIINRVFDPFFTTKDKSRGTGLGLSTAFGFIKQSAGHITVSSQPGKGSCFSIYLPKAEAATRVEPKATRASATQTFPPQTNLPKNKTLLVVEDNTLVRQFAVNQLKAAGYEIIEAETGDQALALFKQGKTFDLLFTDVIMPGELNGLQLAEAAVLRQPGLPVIFTSGYTEDALVNTKASGIGINLINKPYRGQELLLRINDALNQSEHKAAPDEQ